MADVKAIIGCDTSGNPDAEGIAGANVLCNNSVAHINTVQNASLVFPQNTGASVQWTSRNYPVTGTRFSTGFWIRITNPDMGLSTHSQTIFTFSSDGGASNDFSILHRSGLPGADNHGWNIVTAAGGVLALTDNPITADVWHWVTIDHTRHDTAGVVDLKVWTTWPGTTAQTTITRTNFDFKGSGDVSDAVITFTGHQATPAAGGMEFRVGGVYIMDGVSAEADTLPHQEFLSLRIDKNSATPDCDHLGNAGGTNLDSSKTWDLTGDEDKATYAEYTGGVGSKSGGVVTEEYDLHSSVLPSGNHDIGKFIFNTQETRFSVGQYFYGYEYPSGFVVSSLVNMGSLIKNTEHLVFAGDAEYPLFRVSGHSSRSVPLMGFRRQTATARLLEASYLTMWPKNAPGESDLNGEHFMQVAGQCVGRGIAV